MLLQLTITKYSEQGEEMLEQIRRFVEHNYDRLYSIDPAEEAKGVDISFDYGGQSISNPWLDQSARFELSAEQAAATYGAANVISFSNEVNDYMKYIKIYLFFKFI